MSLLKPAVVEQSAAKVGIFGRQASGKTTTAALIMIGLSKTYHGGAPVAMMDTENGSDFIEPIFKAEGVPFIVVKSRAFSDMKGALKEAEQAGCCGYVVDSYTHPWTELCDTFKEKSKRKRLEFHHMDELKRLWRGWTDQMLNSPLHIVLCGRLGYEWGEEEDEGERKLVKLGSKMKSESEAGYEPSLLVEMEGLQDADIRLKKTRTKRGTIVHHAYVLKDRWRTLNGRTFEFKDINTYKVGDYARVFDAFKPHWSQLAIGGAQRAVDGGRTSAALFDSNAQTDGQRRLTRVQIVLEEIEGVLVALWPGQTEVNKAAKRAAVETVFQTRSWTAVSSKPLEVLEDALLWLKAYEAEVKEQGIPADPAAIMAGLMVLREGREAEEAKAVGEVVF